MPRKLSKKIQDIVLDACIHMPYVATSKKWLDIEEVIQEGLSSVKGIYFGSIADSDDIAHTIQVQCMGLGVFEKERDEEYREHETEQRLFACTYKPDVKDIDLPDDIDRFSNRYRVDRLTKSEADDICRAFVPYLLSRGQNTDEMLLAVNLFPKAARYILGGYDKSQGKTGENYAHRSKAHKTRKLPHRRAHRRPSV